MEFNMYKIKQIIKIFYNKFNISIITLLILKVMKRLKHIYFETKFRILRFLIKDKKYIKCIQGNLMILDLNDFGISKELAVSSIREKVATEYTYKILKRGDIVVDIGANIGYYALLEARLVGDNGLVYAIEPAPHNLSLLTQNCKINNYKNILVYECAIGNNDGETTLFISKKHNWNSMIVREELEIVDQINVKTYKLDTFLEDKKIPTYIRMDVEGFEYEIIKGMANLLSRDIPLRLFIEVHPHIMNKSDLIELLKTLKISGFEVELIAKRENLYRDYNSINSLLSDDDFINGSKGAFQVFFKR